LTPLPFKVKYNYIVVRTKSQLGWINLSHSPTLYTVASDCQATSGQIPGGQPEDGIDGYGRMVLRLVKLPITALLTTI